MAVRRIGVFDKTASARYITNGDKKIVFIGMHHIGTKEFYADVKKLCDSLIEADYSLFYEGVRKIPSKDSMELDTMYKKIRQITGLHLGAMTKDGGYIDTVNNTIMGRKFKFISKYHLVNQPRNTMFFRDSLQVKNIDVRASTILAETERKFGPVLLTQYDHSVPAHKKYKYKSKTLKEPRAQFYMLEYRNEVITDSVLSGPNKIALLYGDDHFKGILKNLQAADSSYRQVRRF
jgi:hypothetical protein